MASLWGHYACVSSICPYVAIHERVNRGFFIWFEVSLIPFRTNPLQYTEESNQRDSKDLQRDWRKWGTKNTGSSQRAYANSLVCMHIVSSGRFLLYVTSLNKASKQISLDLHMSVSLLSFESMLHLSSIRLTLINKHIFIVFYQQHLVSEYHPPLTLY